jgi:hypothetical protein
VYSSYKINRFLTLVLVTFALFLSSCYEFSEYGKKSDYEKLGAACIPSSGEVTPPSVSSVSPTDNSTYNSPATTVAVTFSENMETGSVTTNTNDTTCSGSFQLSSDNFTTCIKMSAAPVASDNDTIFTITPASSLSAATTFKVKITTSVKDISCNTLGSVNSGILGFSTSPSGSGTIIGTVQTDDGSNLSGVSLSDSLYGSTVATMTSDSSGDFSQASLALGMHSMTYTKDGYLDLTQTDLLGTDGDTLELETVRLIPDNCASGTMSGVITNAVTGDNLSGVYVYHTSGINKNSTAPWTYFGTTPDNGSWSISMSAGWYTIQAVKAGFYVGYHNAFACGNQSGQNNSLSPTLNEGEMRIILRWPKTNPVTGSDLDSHLQIPYLTPRVDGTECDGDSKKTDKCHLWYGTTQAADNAITVTGVSTRDYHQYTDIVSSGDYVTLDKDHNVNTGSPPGDETMTITRVRSGTYSYSVHNRTDKDNNTGGCCPNYKTNFSKSRAKVKVFYNDQGTLVRKRFNVPNDNGTLWRVFSYDSNGSGSGFTRVQTMSYEDTPKSIY